MSHRIYELVVLVLSPFSLGVRLWDVDVLSLQVNESETRIKQDADNGTVWFIVYDFYWRSEANEQWVESNAQLVSAEWKNVEVYKYESDEQSTVEHIDQRTQTLNLIDDYSVA
jgi:hypothetical protein